MSSVAAKNSSNKRAVKSQKMRKRVSHAIVHVQASFNNTVVTITTPRGDAMSWSTTGERGYKGARKSTPFAAKAAAAEAASKAQRLYGVESVEVRVKGPGPGRESSIRAVKEFFAVTAIMDVSRIPHNGCRPSKERRV